MKPNIYYLLDTISHKTVNKNKTTYKEYTEFKRWLGSRIKSNNKAPILLLSFFKNNYINKEKSKTINKTLIVSKIFDGNLSEYKKNIVFLSKQIQDYLAEKEFYLGNNVIKHFELLKVYQKRQLHKLENTLIIKIKSKLLKGKLRDSNFHYYMSKLYHHQFYSPNFSTLAINNKNEARKVFEQMKRHQQRYYELITAQTNTTEAIWEQIIDFNEEVHWNKTEQKLQVEETEIFENLVKIYQLSQQMMEEDKKHDFSAYKTLRNLINDYGHYVSKNEQLNLIELLINYNAKRISQRDKRGKRFREETWFLYRYGLRYKYLIPWNILSPQHFNNIINVGVYLNPQSRKWLKDIFLNEKPAISIKDEDGKTRLISYQELLHIDEKENILNFNLAQIAFVDGLYTEEKNSETYYQLSLDLLKKVNFTNFEYKLRVRCLTIQNYYELKEWTLCEQKLNNFEAFLRTVRGISNVQKATNKNFITLTRILFKNKSVHMFKKEYNKVCVINLPIMNTLLNNSIANRTWITQKMKEFENWCNQNRTKFSTQKS